MTPVVSILIANWNGRDVLRDCLASVRDMTRDLAYEVIVVDDASTDDSAAMVRREFPGVRLVVRTSNGGFVRANNEGIRNAQGTYVFLLNSDTLLLNNAAKILSDYLDAHPHVGICGGWLKNPDGSDQISFGTAPSMAEALAGALFLNDLFPSMGFPGRGMRPRAGTTESRRVGYISGADLMIRGSLVARMGLFDERFEAYCEEVDLCRRVRTETGLEVHFVPGARIVHLAGLSYGKLSERRLRIQYESYFTFLTKYHGAWYARGVLLLYAWQYALKGVFRSARIVTAPDALHDLRRAEARSALQHVRQSVRAATRRLRSPGEVSGRSRRSL